MKQYCKKSVINATTNNCGEKKSNNNKNDKQKNYYHYSFKMRGPLANFLFCGTQQEVAQETLCSVSTWKTDRKSWKREEERLADSSCEPVERRPSILDLEGFGGKRQKVRKRISQSVSQSFRGLLGCCRQAREFPAVVSCHCFSASIKSESNINIRIAALRCQSRLRPPSVGCQRQMKGTPRWI